MHFRLLTLSLPISAVAFTLSACVASPEPSMTEEGRQQVAEIDALLSEDHDAEVVLESGEERVVCRRERVLGTRISERVCRSVSATEDTAREVRDAHRAMARSTTGPRDPMAGDRGGPQR